MSIKMKELPISERPYEKLEMYGSNSLSNAELLAIIIKTGTREESSVTIAQKILKLNKEQKDNLKFLQNISINELTKIKGIGKIKAIQLKAVAELNKRMSRPILDNKVKITCPQDVANLLIDELKNEKREIVKVLILNTKNIVDKVLETKAKLIYISSVHAIPEKENNDLIEEITDFNPDEVHGLYAKTKAEAAKYVMNAVKNKNLNACIIHPSGIIGPYDYGNSHLTELVREVSNGKLFATVKGGYDFVDVRDVADAIITASKKDNKGECYILSNRYITIKELSDLICDVQGIKKIKIVLPICLAKIIAPFFEAYYNLKKQTPLFTKYSLYTLSSNSNFSNKKAKEELGYKNRDMKDTIKDTISWLNKKGV